MAIVQVWGSDIGWHGQCGVGSVAWAVWHGQCGMGSVAWAVWHGQCGMGGERTRGILWVKSGSYLGAELAVGLSMRKGGAEHDRFGTLLAP